MTELSDGDKDAMQFGLDPERALMKKQDEQKGYFLRSMISYFISFLLRLFFRNKIEQKKI